MNPIINQAIQALIGVLIPVLAGVIMTWLKKKLDSDVKLNTAKQLLIIADDIVSHYKQLNPNNTWLSQADKMVEDLLSQFPKLDKDTAARIVNGALDRAVK